MQQLTVKELARMPWTYQGPVEVEENGEKHFEITIAELPDFFVAAASRSEVLGQLRAALKTFLASYVERNEEVPLPTEQGRWQFRLKYLGSKAPATMTGKVAGKATLKLHTPNLASTGPLPSH